MGVPVLLQRRPVPSVPLPGLVPLHPRPSHPHCLALPPHSVRSSHPRQRQTRQLTEQQSQASLSVTAPDPRQRIANFQPRTALPLDRDRFSAGVSSCNIVISHAPPSTKTPRKAKRLHRHQNMPASLDSSRPIMAHSVRPNPHYPKPPKPNLHHQSTSTHPPQSQEQPAPKLTSRSSAPCRSRAPRSATAPTA
jgi:hypothetical protein